MTEWPPMDRRGPEISEADVSAFEARYGHTMPDEYRRFLLDVNGGRFAATNTKCFAGVINSLFSLADATEARNLEIRALRTRPTLPSPDLIAVGYDDGGARILIALAGPHRGEVWYYQTSDARPADANPRVLWHDRRDMTKLADNWSEFLQALGPLAPAT